MSGWKLVFMPAWVGIPTEIMFKNPPLDFGRIQWGKKSAKNFTRAKRDRAG